MRWGGRKGATRKKKPCLRNVYVVDKAKPEAKVEDDLKEFYLQSDESGAPIRVTEGNGNGDEK